MPFALSEFVRGRPYAYHVTARENATPLRKTRTVRTTADLLAAAGLGHLASTRRKDYLTVGTPDGDVVLKDQKPLIEANTDLRGGWSFADFVRFLNSHIYFWPGTEHAPIGPGRRLLDHYESDGPLVLRVPTADLLRANDSAEPLFCPFNSGAPRYNAGLPAPRGPDLFSQANAFPRRASEVVELAFRGSVGLPDTTTFRVGAGWAAF